MAAAGAFFGWAGHADTKGWPVRVGRLELAAAHADGVHAAAIRLERCREVGWIWSRMCGRYCRACRSFHRSRLVRAADAGRLQILSFQNVGGVK